MIKEFAFGITNRHHFHPAEKTGEWMGLDSDTFVSLWDYDDYAVEYFNEHKSFSGFDGLLYMPDEFILDVDGSSVEAARQKTIALLLLLDDLEVLTNVYFSGTGFHIGVPQTAFRWKPSKDLYIKVKAVLKANGIFEYADPSVSDATRLIRLVNTRNKKSGLFKVKINRAMLHGDAKKILAYASSPKEIKEEDFECEPVFDVLNAVVRKSRRVEQISLGRSPDPSNFPCISSIWESNPVGQRHAVALRLSAWFRWRYPEDMTRLLMEEWRKKVDTHEKPFAENEMENVVKSAYEGHNGDGNRYGCLDSVMDEYCSNTCKLFKAKKSISTMDAVAMEKHLIDFLHSSEDPIDLGALYGTTFPVYPGEVVIIQAPPKSMKTMLLQNWVNTFKVPTYFIEMEMSPRQIWSRFVQIENDWSGEELKAHYMEFRNGMEEKFKWLTVDYSTCYANELQKRMSMLQEKPEIVVVDHMGLFRSKQRDNNMKVEEVSQALMELAIQNNIIVIAVSEITKQAFHEGMSVASTKGSFRTAYNTNKLLSVNPLRDKEGKIKMIGLKCEANREKEMLNVNLEVDPDSGRIYYNAHLYS